MVRSRIRGRLRRHAPSFLAMDISATAVPPVSSVPSQENDSLRRQGHPFQRDVLYKLLGLPGFGTEGVDVDEKEKCFLADLSVARAAVKSVSPVTVILVSRSGISTMSESVTAKLQAAVPDVEIVGPMTDDHYVKMADGKLVLVKQKWYPVRRALNTMWGPGMMDRVSYAILPGKEDVAIVGSLTLAALGTNVYGSLGECARKRNLSAQDVEPPNFKECRRVSIAVEALLQRDLGARPRCAGAAE